MTLNTAVKTYHHKVYIYKNITKATACRPLTFFFKKNKYGNHNLKFSVYSQ